MLHVSSIHTGSRDETLKVWSLKHGQLVTTFTAHHPILDVQLQPYAHRLMLHVERCNSAPILCLHNSPAVPVCKSRSNVRSSLDVHGSHVLEAGNNEGSSSHALNVAGRSPNCYVIKIA